MLLLPFIKLYRLAKRPPLHNGSFTGEVPFSAQTLTLIQEVSRQSVNPFVELLIDDTEIIDFANLPEKGHNIEFVLKLPTSSANRFYKSIEDLCTTESVSRGDLPNEYYIINIDYTNTIAGNNGAKPEGLKTLKTVCKLIKLLSELAHYHDGKTGIGHYKLVFVQPIDANQSQPIVLETKVEKELLGVQEPDISLVERLVASSAKADPHYNSQLGIFFVSLVEFINKRSINQPSFSYLITHWECFLTLYHQNLTTYLSGFAFHKVKQEVADIEFHITEQYSKLVSDITGKLFGIPISFSAIIVMMKSDSLPESTVLVLGLLFVAVLVAGTVDTQQQQLIRIRHGKDIILDAIEGKRDRFPEKLETALKEMKEGLNKSAKKLRNLLRVFRCLAWVPVIAGLIVHTFIYSNNFWIQTLLLYVLIIFGFKPCVTFIYNGYFSKK